MAWKLPTEIMHNGTRKRVENWQAEWSLALAKVPHRLWIKFEGEPNYTRFTSDTTGDFAELGYVE